MDALARWRVSQGERATALDLGVMLENGVLAEDDHLRNRILSSGFLAGISPSEFFGLLDYYCDPGRCMETQAHAQLAIGLATPSRLRANLADNAASSLNSPLYSHVFHGISDDKAQPLTGTTKDSTTHRRRFIAAKTTSEAETVLSQALFQRLMKSLRRDHNEGDLDADVLNTPIHRFGVDSLMAIEIRSWLTKEFAADVPVFEILGEATVSTLSTSAVLKSRLRDAGRI